MRPPAALGKKWRADVIEAERGGERVFVTSIERTVVDVLDRLDLLRRVTDLGVDTLRKAFDGAPHPSAGRWCWLAERPHHGRTTGGRGAIGGVTLSVASCCPPVCWLDFRTSCS